MRIHKLIKGLGLVLLAATLSLPLIAQDANEEQIKATLVKVGEIAPDFEVEMLDGQKVRLSELRGKVVMLNFWASWCSPCMKEFQVLGAKIVEPFVGEDFVLLPVNREESREAVTKKMKAMKAEGKDFPVGLDLDRSIYSLYADAYIPRNFLIDREGRIAYLSVSYSEEEFEELIGEIEKLLKP